MNLKTKRITTGVGVLVLIAALTLMQPRARTALRLVRGFTALDADPRIRYEQGAEYLARVIAASLPAVQALVEELQRAPFARPFRVYVCVTHRGFTTRIGEPADSPARGIAFLRDIWISPKAFSFHGRDTHRQTLTHELSHLHLGQRLGWRRKTKYVPSWFQEGLANWIAGSGDELVSPREACRAILSGHRIVLDESGYLPFPRPPESYGMTWPMFCVQSRMFVEYLRLRNIAAFNDLIAVVVHGARFKSAFKSTFGVSLAAAWQDFLKALESRLPGLGLDIEP